MAAGAPLSSMTPARAKQLAVLGPAAAALMGFVASVSTTGELPAARIIVGAGVASVLLSLMAEAAPGVAGGIAVTLIVTALFVVGEDAWKGISLMLAADGSQRKINGTSTANVTINPKLVAGSTPSPLANWPGLVPKG